MLKIITLMPENSVCLLASDLKIFNPINRSQRITVDNKHDFLKVMYRQKILKNSCYSICNDLNRAEKLKIYRYLGGREKTIPQLKKLGFDI